MAIDLSNDEDEDEVLDDDEWVLKEVQHRVRFEDEESCVEAMTESRSTCEIMFTLTFTRRLETKDKSKLMLEMFVLP